MADKGIIWMVHYRRGLGSQAYTVNSPSYHTGLYSLPCARFLFCPVFSFYASLITNLYFFLILNSHSEWPSSLQTNKNKTISSWKNSTDPFLCLLHCIFLKDIINWVHIVIPQYIKLKQSMTSAWIKTNKHIYSIVSFFKKIKETLINRAMLLWSIYTLFLVHGSIFN